jgi:hypothetical protein
MDIVVSQSLGRSSELEIKYEEIRANMKDLSDRVEFVKRAANFLHG